MKPTAVVLVVLTAAAFPLLLWAIGRTVTAMGERAPYSRGRSHHYLAGRLDGVRITGLIDGGGELLVSLAAPATDAPLAASGPLDKVFRVTASECSLARVPAGEMKAPSCAPTSAAAAPSCSATPCWAATPPANQPPPSPGRPASRQPLKISHPLTTANRPRSAVAPHQRRR